MARMITKTKQRGVRFDIDLLEGIISAGIADSPQKVLNLYERSYVELIELKIKINNEAENKEKIEKERNAKPEEKSVSSPLPPKECEVVNPKTSKLADRLREKREIFLKK